VKSVPDSTCFRCPSTFPACCFADTRDIYYSLSHYLLFDSFHASWRKLGFLFFSGNSSSFPLRGLNPFLPPPRYVDHGESSRLPVTFQVTIFLLLFSLFPRNLFSIVRCLPLFYASPASPASSLLRAGIFLTSTPLSLVSSPSGNEISSIIRYGRDPPGRRCHQLPVFEVC